MVKSNVEIEREIRKIRRTLFTLSDDEQVKATDKIRRLKRQLKRSIIDESAMYAIHGY